MSYYQFTGTAMQPQRNRKFCQFDNDQYCNCMHANNVREGFTVEQPVAGSRPSGHLHWHLPSITDGYPSHSHTGRGVHEGYSSENQ